MAMTHKKMIRLIDHEEIREAIQKAEHRTSGEIRVSVARLFWGNVHKAAEKAFVRLGMTRTKDRNGVLFLVVAVVSERFRRGDFTGGLIRGIEEVGEQLSTHFPYVAAADVDELPDDVD